MATMICEHVEEIRDVQPSSDGCLECLQTGDDWVHLRLCLTCGHVGVAILPRTNTLQNTFKKLIIPLSSRLNLVKIGAGAMSTTLCWRRARRRIQSRDRRESFGRCQLNQNSSRIHRCSAPRTAPRPTHCS